MGSAIVDGFERGFNMMERHNARVGRSERMARIDQQNNDRYQEGQDRLSRIDQQNNDRYNQKQTRLTDLDQQNNDRYNDKVDRQSIIDKSTLAANQSRTHFNEYRLNKAQKDDNRRTDQQTAQRAWAYSSRNGGKINPEFKVKDPDNNWFMPGHNFGKDYVAKTDNFLAVAQKSIDTGDFSIINTPENMSNFKTMLPEIFKVKANERDLKTGKLITQKDPAGLVPVNGGVTIGLKLTYEDGTTRTEARTKFGSSAPEDNPKVYDLKELFHEAMTRKRLAEFQKHPEKFKQRMDSTLNMISPQANKYSNSKAIYRKEINTIKKERRAAMSKLDGVLSASQEKAFKNALDEIDVAYGVKTKTDKINDPLGLNDDGNNLLPKPKPKPSVDLSQNNKPTEYAKDGYKKGFSGSLNRGLDNSGFSTMGKSIYKNTVGVLIDFSNKKQLESYLVGKLGRMPTEQELSDFIKLKGK